MADEATSNGEGTRFERRKLFAVVRKGDGHVVALCEDVVDAVKVALRASRQGNVEIQEAEVELSIALTGRRFSTV